MTIARVPRAWLPETKSGRQKGFRHFSEACWFGDMVSTSPPVLVVLELALHQNSEAMESGTSVRTRLVHIQTCGGDSLNA